MEGCNAAKAGTGIRKVHMADSRIRMGTVSCGIRLALVDYINPADFYPIVYSAENQKLVDRGDYAWRTERP